jgi:hypothetical protein
MPKTALLIVLDFPPSNTSSIQRVVSFYRQLKHKGWDVVVLTADTRIYINKSENINYFGIDWNDVHRAKAFDASRDFSIKGKHLSYLSLPDKFSSWIPYAYILGKKLIAKHQPDIIWSTSPGPSANLIAHLLKKKSGIPWVADYRDPLLYLHDPAGGIIDFVHKKIDSKVVKNANLITFATQAVADKYSSYYKNEKSIKCEVINNGFEESNFEILEDNITQINSEHTDKKFTLYYAGALYASGRDPSLIFEAISKLKQQNVISEDNFQLVFQGSGDGAEFSELLIKLNIEKLIHYLSPIPFMDALEAMIKADALLVIQDERFNLQIPGKIYEYLRTYRPIIAKTPINSATGQLCQLYDGCTICNDITEMTAALKSVFTKGRQQKEIRNLNSLTRAHGANKLVEIFDSITKDNL